MTRLIRRLRERNPEEGFTLVEVAVALGIFFISLMALAQAAIVGFRDVAFARQRQTGNQIANQILEEVRGLAYEHVTKGLAAEDLAGDPNIIDCGGVPYFKVCPPDPAAEPIVHTPGLAPVTPLVPHRGSVGAAEGYTSTYDWSVYVMQALDAPEAGAYRVWSIVEWNRAANQGARNSVETQTLIFAPSGCLDLATHPFGAPCQAYHAAVASIGGGGATVTGPVEQVAYDSFAVDLVNQGSTVQTEQVPRVDGSSLLPGGRRVVGGLTSSIGRTLGTSQADGDPATPAGDHDATSLLPQGGGFLSASSTGSELRAIIGGSDTGSTVSTTAASASNPCTTQNDGLPCGYNAGKHVGAMSLTLKIPEDGGIGTLVSVGAGTESTTYTRRAVPVAGTDGLARSIVTRAIPEVRVGGLPAKASPPPGWAEYWFRLINYTATLQAEAGENTVAPTASVSGTLEYWNGSGYSSVAVNNTTKTVTPAPLDLSISGTGFGSGRVLISGEVTVRGTTISQETGDPATTRSEARAVANAPVFSTMSYVIRRGGNTIADLLVAVDLGRAYAQANYQPAPTP